MAIRLYRAYSPGTRSRSSLFFDDLSKSKPEKSLTFGKKRCSGRNNRGIITLKGRGGGHKRKYRVIDFQRKETNSVAKVVGIEYDPNRNARIAKLHYADGSKKYIISPRSLKVGATLYYRKRPTAMHVHCNCTIHTLNRLVLGCIFCAQPKFVQQGSRT